ncbi:inovirus Gp2 family protein [Ferrimonas gelatinilytica]|uniref:Inovirus Gp2 family protein n=1 Tax=Ferrimonas gelatinilytica TaxID=1255257 RepID=A0ABP9S8D6_9GAMM
MPSHTINSHGPLDQRYLERIHQTIHHSVNDYPRTLALRVDLRLPGDTQNMDPMEQDTPDHFADTDPSVISRFMASLNAKIQADLSKKKNAGKRIYPCKVRYVWAREQNREHKTHYHTLLLFNNDAYFTLGDYRDLNNVCMATRIIHAWCSALRVDPMEFATLVHFPDNPLYYLNRNSSSEEFQQSFNELFYRASYLAKKKSKIYGTGFRNFGCSQH